MQAKALEVRARLPVLVCRPDPPQDRLPDCQGEALTFIRSNMARLEDPRNLVHQLDIEHIYPNIDPGFVYREFRLSRLDKIYSLADPAARLYISLAAIWYLVSRQLRVVGICNSLHGYCPDSHASRAGNRRSGGKQCPPVCIPPSSHPGDPVAARVVIIVFLYVLNQGGRRVR